MTNVLPRFLHSTWTKALALVLAQLLCLPAPDLLAAVSDSTSTRSIFANKQANHRAIIERNLRELNGKRGMQEPSGRNSGGNAGQPFHTAAPGTFDAPVLLADLSGISIPSADGQVLETWQPSQGTSDEKGTVPFSSSQPTVILLQDLHTQPEAQRAEARILDHLAKTYGIKRIASEGAWKPIDVSIAREFPLDNDLRRLVADTEVEAGQFTAEEFLAVTAPYELELTGVEDEALYRRHVEVYQRAMEASDRSAALRESLLGAVEALKPRMYGPALREVAERRAAFDAGRVAFPEYVGFLADRAGAAGVEWATVAPNVERLRRLQELEASIDRDAAHRAFVELLGDVARRDGAQAGRVNDLAARLQQGSATPAVIYSELLDAATRLGVDLAPYAAFTGAAEYAALSQQVAMHKVAHELSLVEAALEEGLAATEAERMLARTARRAALLDDLCNLRLNQRAARGVPARPGGVQRRGVPGGAGPHAGVAATRDVVGLGEVPARRPAPRVRSFLCPRP